MPNNVTELMKNWNVSLSGALSALVTLLVCLVVTRIALKLLRRLLNNSKLDARMQKYVLSGAKVLLYLLTAIIVVGSLVLDLISMLVAPHLLWLGNALYLVSIAAWVYALFRIFSRNLTKRRGENQRWMSWIWRMKSSQQGARARHADKAHKYFTCKNCKTICRVPVGKGKIIITCPKCGAQIHAKT